MNIIDRSPMKTTAQEALLTQSARRINEAKTAEEKASVVQNFAEQLRLEKLRAKRLQANMQELNMALTNPSTKQTPPLAIGSGTATPIEKPPQPVKSILKSMIKNKETTAAAPGWMNSYATNLDAFQNGNGNANGPKSAAKEGLHKSSISYEAFGGQRSSKIDYNLDFMKSQTSENTSSSSDGYKRKLSNTPLNVNAAPFVMQPKSPSSSASTAPVNTTPFMYPTKTGTNQPIIPASWLTDAAPGRACISPPLTVVAPPLVLAAAVAPKVAPVVDFRQPNPIDGRQRSSSIGALQNKSVLAQLEQQRQQKQQQAAVGEGGDEITYIQRSKIYPQMSIFPIQSNDSSSTPNKQPNMGNVKIENMSASGGGPLLKAEDWDLEYAQLEKQQPKPQSPPPPQPNTGKPTFIGHRIPSMVEHVKKEKDWVSVLKERDNISKRRYSRETMGLLTNSPASKIRPPHLSPDYNTESGIWSPDLWFHHNFQLDQPQKIFQRKPFTMGRNGLSIDSATDPQMESGGLRRITCLSALQQQNQDEEGKQQQQQQQRSSVS